MGCSRSWQSSRTELVGLCPEFPRGRRVGHHSRLGLLEHDDVLSPHRIGDYGNASAELAHQSQSVRETELNQEFIYALDLVRRDVEYLRKLIVIGSDDNCADSPWNQNSRAFAEDRSHVGFVELELVAGIATPKTDHALSELWDVDAQVVEMKRVILDIVDGKAVWWREENA